MLLLGMVLMLVGCAKKPQEIFEEQKSGVVLICNQFYYDITLYNGNHLYFSGLDDDGDFANLTADLAEIKKSPAILNGTGFFIDHSGRILTNRHVVAPQIDKEAVRKNVNTIIEGYASYIEALQDSMAQRYQAIQAYAQESVYQDSEGNSYTSMSQDEVSTLESELESLKEQYAEAQNLKNDIRSNILNNNFSIQLHSEFGIAYDGSNMGSWDDFMKTPCRLLRVSQDANSDLALLQLNKGATPRDVYVFTIDDDNIAACDHLEINQQLYMIGYNAGPQLANTRRGIQVQMTSGKVTQLPDGERVLYSIPTVQGSSGSPVVSESGALVAVNFAKLVGSDNFNFGIPLNRVEEFMKDN